MKKKLLHKVRSVWTKLNSNVSVVHFIHAFATQLLFDTGVSVSVSHVVLQRDFSETAVYSVLYAMFSLAVRVLREKFKPQYALQATVEVEREAGAVDKPNSL